MNAVVADILASITNREAETISASDNLLIDLRMSSLDLMEMVLAFEQELGIKIPDKDVHRFMTVGSIVDYLDEHKR